MSVYYGFAIEYDENLIERGKFVESVVEDKIKKFKNWVFLEADESNVVFVVTYLTPEDLRSEKVMDNTQEETGLLKCSLINIGGVTKVSASHFFDIKKF